MGSSTPAGVSKSELQHILITQTTRGVSVAGDKMGH